MFLRIPKANQGWVTFTTTITYSIMSSQNVFFYITVLSSLILTLIHPKLTPLCTLIMHVFFITLLSSLILTLIISVLPCSKQNGLTLLLDFIFMTNGKIQCNITIYIVEIFVPVRNIYFHLKVYWMKYYIDIILQ